MLPRQAACAALTSPARHGRVEPAGIACLTLVVINSQKSGRRRIGSHGEGSAVTDIRRASAAGAV